jgi:hypothetical protein
MTLEVLNDSASQVMAISGDSCKTPQAAAKDVLRKHHDLQEEMARAKEPVDLGDELKAPLRRFQA